jgi:hypothetical protein
MNAITLTVENSIQEVTKYLNEIGIIYHSFLFNLDLKIYIYISTLSMRNN